MSKFKGLTQAEAEKRLIENGRNCLKEEKQKMKVGEKGTLAL